MRPEYLSAEPRGVAGYHSDLTAVAVARSEPAGKMRLTGETQSSDEIEQRARTCIYIASSTIAVVLSLAHSRLYIVRLVETLHRAAWFKQWLQLRFDCDSTARRPFDDLHYDRTPTRVRVLPRCGLNKLVSVTAARGLRHSVLNDL